MLFPFLVSPPKIPSLPPLLPNLSTRIPSPGIPLYWNIGPRASPPIDDQLCHPLLHMQLEPQVPPCVFFDWWFSPREVWGYWLSCSSFGAANPFSFLGTFSNSFIGDLVLCPMDDCEHPLLYFPGTGRVSQETAISGSFQQALLGIYNSDWVGEHI